MAITSSKKPLAIQRTSTAERARQEDRFNHFEMNNGRLGNRPSVSRQNARCVEISAGPFMFAAIFRILNASIGVGMTPRGATPPSEPDGRISRIRLSSRWVLIETDRKHKSRVPD
jgi:hypothetical protein